MLELRGWGMKLNPEIPPGFVRVTHGKVKIGDWVADWRDVRWVHCTTPEWPVGDNVGEMDGVMRKKPKNP